MKCLNQISLIGGVGDITGFNVNKTGPALNFVLATSEKFSTKLGERENTEWHRIVVFGKLADICHARLRKGTQIFLQGKLQYKPFVKQGVEFQSADIMAEEIIFLSNNSVFDLED